eukprot:TRINITY_DN4376_c0_g1_i1.p1 TRINITY_DN4376_c0_g1~~TRINITY_DN4376_c0_g1_i1.p1  ORF type:complete len:431 (+),score=69.51 TRINITY_DN4376_c0_g1_i1:30-1295(+)
MDPDTGHDGSPGEDIDVREEQACFLRTVSSFRHYYDFTAKLLRAKRLHYAKVAPRHRALLPNYESHFDNMQRCLEANTRFVAAICENANRMFYGYWPEGSMVKDVEPPTNLDMDKVLSTLRQFSRDWSAEGQPEREACYSPLLKQLEQCFPDRSQRGDIRVLVPGSGLSRLAYDIFRLGFFSQGSEFSYHMLIAGSYLLNTVPTKEFHTIYPFVHQTTNNKERADPIRPIVIPDVCPLEEACQSFEEDAEEREESGGGFSMCAGEFLEVYTRPEQRGTWHAVVCSFFIDTAHNIFEYIEAIHGALVVGGVWLNVGPLLYHFADQVSEKEMSVELSWADVRDVILQFGFQILEERDVENTYTTNPRGMMRQIYTSVYFHAVKTDRCPALEAAQEQDPASGPRPDAKAPTPSPKPGKKRSRKR